MKVLVLLATYNGEQYIEEQIHSIFKQEGVSVDILISDDKSSDRTNEIIERLINEGLSIKLIKRDKGTGSAAKNFMSLIRLVENLEKYCAFSFSDQDDIWLPRKLIEAVKKIKIDNIDLYASNLILWDQRVDKKQLLKKSFKQKRYDFLFEGGSAGCTYVCSDRLFKDLRIAISYVNYKDWKGFSHDWFIYFFARLNNYNVFIDPQPYILYRIHNNNVHGHLNTNSINSLLTRINLVRNGWYLGHIKGFSQLLPPECMEKEIYKIYQAGIINRIYLSFRYNLKLFRSPMKFIYFAILCFLPQKSISDDI